MLDQQREPAGCLADSGPDAWGQRIIHARRAGRRDATRDAGDLSALTYLLESGSDRIGALDFQGSPSDYVPRTTPSSLAQLQGAAELLEAGETLSPALEAALLHGTSIGGARPKALLDDGPRHLIAKFSSASDPYPVVRAEAVAMDLARRVGLNVARTELTTSLGKDVLLVERFDRTEIPGERRLTVSALTILGLHAMTGRYATYPDLGDQIRARLPSPRPPCGNCSPGSCSTSLSATSTIIPAITPHSGTESTSLLRPPTTSARRCVPARKRLRRWRSDAMGAGAASSAPPSTRRVSIT